MRIRDRFIITTDQERRLPQGVDLKFIETEAMQQRTEAQEIEHILPVA